MPAAKRSSKQHQQTQPMPVTQRSESAPARFLLTMCDMHPLHAAQSLATLEEIGQTIDHEISEVWAVPRVPLAFLKTDSLRSFPPEVLSD